MDANTHTLTKGKQVIYAGSVCVDLATLDPLIDHFQVHTDFTLNLPF